MLRFTVHRPGNPVASPCSHRMPCGDIPGCVHVSVTAESACGAPEDGLTLARLLVHLPTHTAPLASERRVDLLDSASCLPVKSTDELPPAICKDLPVKPSLLGHAPPRRLHSARRAPGHIADAEILDTNQVEATCQISAGLFAPVLASVSLPRPQTCSHSYATVHTDYRTCTRARDGWGNRGERNMPPACAIKSDAKRLDSVRDDARPAKPHPAALRNENFTGFPIQPAHMSRFDCHHAESFVAPSFAPSRPPVRACKKALHSPVKVAQRLLLHHLAPMGQPGMFPSRGCELPALLQVAGRVRPPSMPPRVLLTGQVPHEASMRTMHLQGCFLAVRRKQAVAGHAKTVSSSTDTLREVKRRVLLCLVTEIGTPRTR